VADTTTSLADPDSAFLDVMGVTVHYKKKGNGPATIVFLHGFGSSVFAWYLNFSNPVDSPHQNFVFIAF
jgi:pimeloyl-ACP methyl ester carboxylesterase